MIKNKKGLTFDYTILLILAILFIAVVLFFLIGKMNPEIGNLLDKINIWG